MRAYVIEKPGDAAAPVLTDRPDPVAGPGQVVVRVRAVSLNYRDLVILKGGYPRNDNFPTVAASDAAGEVEAVGEGVADLKVGDRVMANFMRDWVQGPPTEAALRSSLGGGVDGVLAERVALPADSLVRIPEHLDYEQAATLPCAGLTAWNGLMEDGGLRPGHTVLLLGTGGVSVFGLQLAKAAGCRTIITSSDDAKLDRARELGADETINYQQHPDWHEAVRGLTGGVGVDRVLEVGGPGTFERSVQATRVGGVVALIGLLSQGTPSVLPVLMQALTVRGIYVGSAEMLGRFAQAVAVSRLEPEVDRVFGFEDAAEAYGYFAQQRHVGKVVIRVA